MKTQTTAQLIETARKHLGKGCMVSSARQCLDDAVALLDAGDDRGARQRARHSIVYSVGVFHPDYANSGQ